MTDVDRTIPATAVDEQALATHLRDLADGLETGEVTLTSAADHLEADPNAGPLEGGLDLTYTVPPSRPELLVALELSDRYVDEEISRRRRPDDSSGVDEWEAVTRAGAAAREEREDDAPTADGESIPSSVDRDAPPSDPTTVRRDKLEDAAAVREEARDLLERRTPDADEWEEALEDLEAADALEGTRRPVFGRRHIRPGEDDPEED